MLWRSRGQGPETTESREVCVPWQRPGFGIGLLIEPRIEESPGAKGVLLLR